MNHHSSATIHVRTSAIGPQSSLLEGRSRELVVLLLVAAVLPPAAQVLSQQV
jgi:hypothetical protein